jgi:hypothetical protein
VFLNQIDKQLSEGTIIGRLREVVGTIGGTVRDENTSAFQAAVVVIKELPFYSGKLREGDTIGRGRDGIVVVGVAAAGQFGKRAGSPGCFMRALGQSLKIGVFSTEEVINMGDVIKPFG